MKLQERKTVKGVVRAKCPKCDQWKPLDVENFYMGKDGEPYLGHCRECERTRSAAWHRAHRAEKKAATSAKKSTARKATAKRSTAKRTRKTAAA